MISGLMIFTLLAAPTDAVGSQSWHRHLETEMAALLEEAAIPAISMAVVKDGEIVYSAATGVADTGKGNPVTPDTLFQAASLSKPVFAYIVMKLVDQGRIDLDKPLRDYWAYPDIEGEAQFGKATARLALSHSAGFPNWRGNGPLHFLLPPGERFSYSGEGYVYLQRVVEHVTGERLQQLADTLVFRPLGMKHSSYEWGDGFHAATGHSEDGIPRAGDPMTEGNAAFSLYTTAQDYARFLIAVMRGDGLTVETHRLLLTPARVLDRNCMNCTGRKQPVEPSPGNAWALGWGLEESAAGRAIWHWGDQGIFRAFVMGDLNAQTGLVYFTNSSNGLAIRDRLVAATIGGDHPAFPWLGYDQVDAPLWRFKTLVLQEGIAAGMERYHQLVRSGQAPFQESVLNRLGYTLMSAGRLDDAVTILEANVTAYPDSFNVYDSLGEAYLKRGDLDPARANYQKSLQLNADNDNAKQMLAQIAARKALVP